jgi:hypothetical protein
MTEEKKDGEEPFLKLAPGVQIVKCRDDGKPFLMKIEAAKDGTFKCKVHEKSDVSWLQKGDFEGTEKIRSHIEPWLTALFQSEHLSLLAGSGIMHAACHGVAKSQAKGMSPHAFSLFSKEIDAAAVISAKNAGRHFEENKFYIEDQLRAANELLRGLQILGGVTEKAKTEAAELEKELVKVLTSFANGILESETLFITGDKNALEEKMNYLVSFLMSFASRTGIRERLQIFTTNYERLIEIVAEVAGLYLVDRFVGTIAPIFRSSRMDMDIHYNPPGIRGEPRYVEGVARFSKLHGSVDWVNVDRNIRRVAIPFGAKNVTNYLEAPGFNGATPFQLMIYPNSSKDRETASYPYVELFRDFACAVCRPNSCVVSYGYSFGDEHINRVLEDMLTIPSTHLVIISRDDPTQRIINTYVKMGRPAQITLLLGDHFGTLEQLVDHYLPKPAIDRTTYRMADLLRARWSTSVGAVKDPEDDTLKGVVE